MKQDIANSSNWIKNNIQQGQQLPVRKQQQIVPF